MNIWEYAIARRFRQLVETAEQRELTQDEIHLLLRLERHVKQFQARDETKSDTLQE